MICKKISLFNKYKDFQIGMQFKNISPDTTVVFCHCLVIQNQHFEGTLRSLVDTTCFFCGAINLKFKLQAWAFVLPTHM